MNWGGFKKNRAPRASNSSPPSFKKRFAPVALPIYFLQLTMVASCPTASSISSLPYHKFYIKPALPQVLDYLKSTNDKKNYKTL